MVVGIGAFLGVFLFIFTHFFFDTMGSNAMMDYQIKKRIIQRLSDFTMVYPGRIRAVNDLLNQGRMLLVSELIFLARKVLDRQHLNVTEFYLDLAQDIASITDEEFTIVREEVFRK